MHASQRGKIRNYADIGAVWLEQRERLSSYRPNVGAYRNHRCMSSVNFRGARHFCPKKINKIPEFYMILAQKINKIPEFYIIIARKYFSRIFFLGGGLPPSPMPMVRTWSSVERKSRNLKLDHPPGHFISTSNSCYVIALNIISASRHGLRTNFAIMPNTHRRRRRDETVLSRRRRRCVHEFATSSRRLPTDSIDN